MNTAEQRTSAEAEMHERQSGAGGFRESDGRYVVYRMGLMREKEKAGRMGLPYLPGAGLYGIEITAEVKPDGEIDIETLRVEAYPLADFRNAKPTP